MQLGASSISWKNLYFIQVSAIYCGEPTMDKLDRLQRDEILEIVTENDWVALIIFE